jgi:hypothetical protein
VESLNEQSETISQKIEREVRRILPPTVTVQANVQFDEGSILVTGVVALLSWATPIVRDAAKEELGELVKLAIKRVISRYLPFSASPIELSVTPQSSTPDRTSTRIFAGNKISTTTALFVITGLILIFQVLTLLDRVFFIHLRP